jgi:hypothetical protein
METNETKYTEVKNWDDSAKQAHAAKCGGERNLVEVDVITNDNYRFSYLVKRPTKTIVQAIAEIEAKHESKKEPKDKTNIQNLMLGCVLEGDKDAYDNDAAIYSVLMKRISELVKEAKVDLKK